MFTNFKSAFKENKDDNIRIPNEIIKILNKELPKELEYYQFERGICGIVPKNSDVMSIKTRIKLPDIPEKIRNEIRNFDDLYEYLYRTQKSCEIVPDENGNIMINNVAINIRNFIKDAISNTEIEKFEMFPKSFPKPIKMNIQAGELIREFTIQRQPYESMDTIYLKTIEDKPLNIKFYIKSDNKIDVNININISEIENISEIVEACEYYKNFLEGKVILGNSEIRNFKGNPKNSETHIEEKLTFWKKSLELERYLKKSLNAEKLKEEQYIKVLRLYKSLIENEPFKIKNKINALNVDDCDFYEEALEMKGKTMLFEYTKEEEINIFNRKIKVYILERIYNYMIKDVLKQEDKIKIILEESSERKSFVAQKYFLSDEELKKEMLNTEENHDRYLNAEII